MYELKFPDGFDSKAVRGIWFEVNDLNHSATDTPFLGRLFLENTIIEVL
jgi:hypothetical protein